MLNHGHRLYFNILYRLTKKKKKKKREKTHARMLWHGMALFDYGLSTGHMKQEPPKSKAKLKEYVIKQLISNRH